MSDEISEQEWQRRYERRDPRYADLPYYEWRSAIDTHPVDLPCFLSWQLWLGQLSVSILMAYTIAWYIVGLVRGTDDTFLLSASLSHTPIISATNGSLHYTATHGLSMYSYTQYTERVWLLGVDSNSSETLHTHFFQSSSLSSSCGYTVVSNVTSLTPPTSNYNDLEPEGDESDLTVPGCSALSASYMAFLAFCVLQWVFYFLFTLDGVMNFAAVVRGRAALQRDLTSDGQEPAPTCFGFQLTPAGGHRAPMPSQQRMVEHFTPLQLNRLDTATRWWRVELVVLTAACACLVVSLVSAVAFVRTEGFEDAKSGPFFGVHVAGCVAYLTLLPLSLFFNGRVLSEERERTRTEGSGLDTPSSSLLAGADMSVAAERG